MALSNPSTRTRTFDYDVGVKLMSAGKYHEALSQFRGVAASDADHAMANFQAGRIMLEAFQAADAIAWFAKAASIGPEMAQVWQGWAEAVALGGSTEQRDALLAALKTAPIKPDLRIQLQDRFGSRRKSSRPKTGGVDKATIKALIAGLNKSAFQKVERQAAKVLSAAPKSAVAAFILAEAQAKSGKTKAAFANYQQAVKLDPLYAEAYCAMGQLLFSVNQSAKAANAFRPAVILAPDSVPALVGLTRALESTGNQAAAIVLIERASRLEPRNALLRTALGDAWKRAGERETARERYEEALELYARPGDAPVSLRLALVDVRSQTGQDAVALADTDEILRDAPQSVDALISKASILQSRGDFEDSEATFRQAIELEPENGEAYRRMLVSRKTKPGDPLIDQMVAQFEKPGLSKPDRMNLGFALGKALEDAREDKRVFQYLNEANRIAAEMSQISARQLFFEIANGRDVYSEVDFANVAPATQNTFAPIFVTGLPRSGTTLVEQIIAAHSTVDSGGELGVAKPLCRETRTALPGSDKAADNPTALAEIGRTYTQVMQHRFPNVDRLTDKSIYTFLALGPLKLALPKARFVVVRRDPRDNLLSIYKNKFPDGSHGYANNLETLARYYNEFDRTVAFWRDRVPDWFYEVSYDALVNDPETEARKLIAACGLDWEDDCLSFHKKKNKVQTLSVYQVRQPITKASVSGWRRFESDLAPMIDQLRKDGHVSD